MRTGHALSVRSSQIPGAKVFVGHAVLRLATSFLICIRLVCLPCVWAIWLTMAMAVFPVPGCPASSTALPAICPSRIMERMTPAACMVTYGVVRIRVRPFHRGQRRGFHAGRGFPLSFRSFASDSVLGFPFAGLHPLLFLFFTLPFPSALRGTFRRSPFWRAFVPPCLDRWVWLPGFGPVQVHGCGCALRCVPHG